MVAYSRHPAPLPIATAALAHLTMTSMFKSSEWRLEGSRLKEIATKNLAKKLVIALLVMAAIIVVLAYQMVGK